MALGILPVVVFLVANLYLVTCQYISDIGLTPPEIIANHGYPVETHEVLTDDGYILQLHRIPHGINNNDTDTHKIPVLVQHGMAANSGDFISLGSNRSLGFILADRGYDVWLGNARGNTWSAKHISIDPVTDPQKYFNFSWHEMGVYDLPGSIDYILNETGASAIHYIGYSQGSTSFYVMASSRPEYNKKIILASLMGPPAYMSNTADPYLQVLTDQLDSLQVLSNDLKLFHVPNLDIVRLMLRDLCQQQEYADFCIDVLFLFIGFADYDEIDKSMLPVYLSNTPADFSLKQAFHYGQLIRSGHFQQFDYGNDTNIEIYGSESPPNYNITLITAPVALYYGKNDNKVSPLDVELMASLLPNLVKDYLIPYEKFNHGDFLIAKDAATFVYEEVIEEMKRHE